MLGICLTCKRFDRITNDMGVCSDTNISTGVSSTYHRWDGDIERVIDLYFGGKSLEEAINIVKKRVALKATKKKH